MIDEICFIKNNSGNGMRWNWSLSRIIYEVMNEAKLMSITYNVSNDKGNQTYMVHIPEMLKWACGD